jgi:hypothetical protein
LLYLHSLILYFLDTSIFGRPGSLTCHATAFMVVEQPPCHAFYPRFHARFWWFAHTASECCTPAWTVWIMATKAAIMAI